MAAGRLRVCHVITRLIVGGAQENTLLTCRGLAELGHEVLLVAGPETGPEGSLWTQTAAGGFETRILDCLRRAVSPWNDARAFRELKRLFREWRPDIVHTHSSKAGILARAAASAARVPVIVHTIHGMSFNRTQRRFVQAAYRAAERWAARRTHMIVTVADAMIEQSVRAGVADRAKFVTIRSGLETEAFHADPIARERRRREWGVSDDNIVVGTVARLFENKGYEEIIEAVPGALARDGRLKFVWVGDGAHRGRYEHRLVELGIRDRVHFAGLIPPVEMPSYFAGFDIVVHASRWEGLPRALVQSLLMEVPVVSFDNDGAPEVVIPGETGKLVPLDDISGLAAALVELAADRVLRERMGRAGRAKMLTMYDGRRMVRDIVALYHGLMRGS